MVGPGADYLAECYRLGLKDAIHVLDIHPYTKYATPAVPGGQPGAPESVLSSLASCRRVMHEFDDDDRPLIASEAGHPTHQGRWFMPACTPEVQARWVVRSHLLLLAGDVRRIYWYAFQDEGTDASNPEHNFGLIDWFGTPKPAYHAYATMSRLLGSTRCMGFVDALTAPAYGVAFRGDRNWITALWDCGGDGEIELAATGEPLSAVTLLGEALLLPPPSDGAITLPVSETVTYVQSNEPLRILAQRRFRPPVEPMLDVELNPTTVHVQPGGTARWTVRLHSHYFCSVRAVLTCSNPWQGPPLRQEVTLGPEGTDTVEFEIAVPDDAPRKIHSWDTRCVATPVATDLHERDVCRAMFFIVERP